MPSRKSAQTGRYSWVHICGRGSRHCTTSGELPGFWVCCGWGSTGPPPCNATTMPPSARTLMCWRRMNWNIADSLALSRSSYREIAGPGASVQHRRHARHNRHRRRRFRQDRRRQSGRHEFLVLDRLGQAVQGLIDLRPARQLLQILRVGRRFGLVGKIFEDCRTLDASIQ